MIEKYTSTNKVRYQTSTHNMNQHASLSVTTTNGIFSEASLSLIILSFYTNTPHHLLKQTTNLFLVQRPTSNNPLFFIGGGRGTRKAADSPPHTANRPPGMRHDHARQGPTVRPDAPPNHLPVEPQRFLPLSRLSISVTRQTGPVQIDDVRRWLGVSHISSIVL